MGFFEKLLPGIITGLAQAKLKKAEVQAAEVGAEFDVKGVAHGIKIFGRKMSLDLRLKVTK